MLASHQSSATNRSAESFSWAAPPSVEPTLAVLTINESAAVATCVALIEAALREKRPDVFKEIGKKLEKLKGIEFLSVETFEKRLADMDVLGPDDLGRYRRPVLKYSRMDHEPTEFVSDFDTHHLLFISALKPGWYCVGRRWDVPRNACYVGHYGDTYVWVPPQNIELLTRLTMAILDIHTFRSERIGGSRIQPGLQPRF